MNIVKAGAEELIWIVVGIFWVIAQIAGGATKKKMTPPPRPMDTDGQEEPPALSDAEGFADLMRKLSGVQEIKAPTPPKPIKQTVDATSPSRSVPAQDATRTSHLRSKEIAEVDIRPTMSSFKTAMPAMKLPAMNLSFQPTEKSGSFFPKVGKIIDPSNKQSLRHAMLSHIILGKPRAMGG